MTAPTETNTTTHFLRELRALHMIRDLVAIPNAAAQRKTVVWSVGCSTGDEPYGLAMVCRQAACVLPDGCDAPGPSFPFGRTPALRPVPEVW